MASPNAPSITQAAAQDASRITAEQGIDLDTIGEAEARKIMSEEHRALGYRPPRDSLASAAQAAAARHPQPKFSTLIDEGTLTRAARNDAVRIASERHQAPPAKMASEGINLDVIGEAEARKLMSMEHKALGYRPPTGSLAAEAQAAAAKHPFGAANGLPKPGLETLTEAALKDATRIQSERHCNASDVKLDTVTKEGVRKTDPISQRLLGSAVGSLTAETQPIVRNE